MRTLLAGMLCLAKTNSQFLSLRNHKHLVFRDDIGGFLNWFLSHEINSYMMFERDISCATRRGLRLRGSEYVDSFILRMEAICSSET
jgi:hypothetical protein